MAPPEKFTVAQIAQAIEHSQGFISRAIDFLSEGRGERCTYKTFHHYLDKYPELADLRAHYRAKMVDLAEVGLMDRIVQGDTVAMIWVTKCLGKDRGWVERVEHTGAEGTPIKVLHLPVVAATVEEWTSICKPPALLPSPDASEEDESSD